MHQRSTPGATLPQDAYEQERMANVRPSAWRNPKPAGRYDLVVVGGGPAGLGAGRAAGLVGAGGGVRGRALLGGAVGGKRSGIDGRESRARRASAARWRLPERRLHTFENDHPNSQALRRD